MKEQYISRISMGINILIFAGLGIALIALPKDSLSLFHLLASILITIAGLLSFLGTILKKKKEKLGISLTTLCLGIVISFNPKIFLSSFSMFFGFYLIINSIIEAITLLIKFSQKLNGKLQTSVILLIELTMGLSFLLHPYHNIQTGTILLGIYLMSLSLTYIYDLLKDIFPNLFRLEKRHIRISIPVFIATFLPYNTLLKINKVLDKNITTSEIEKKKVSGNIDLEIFIHVKEKGNGRFGHADFCFENKVYSYGNYDPDSFKLWESLGDGILFEIDHSETYLKFCTTHSHKTMFVYGITLNEKQKEKIKKQLNKLKETTYRWYAKAEMNPSPNEKDYKDYPSILYCNTKAKFYKFKSGSFKTYFLMSTNCVKLVDYIVGVTGIDLLKMTGIITPGTYYYYLDKEFKKRNSIVISKKIYTNK